MQPFTLQLGQGHDARLWVGRVELGRGRIGDHKNVVDAHHVMPAHESAAVAGAVENPTLDFTGAQHST